MPAHETVNPIRLGINDFPTLSLDYGIHVGNDGFMGQWESSIYRHADVVDDDAFLRR
jgi:hypothetical protein